MIGDSIFDLVNPEDFIYGPSYNGSGRALTDMCKCREVNDLDNEECLSMLDLSKQTIMNSVEGNYKIVFDLTHMEDIQGVLSNTGDYANRVTSLELRFIKENFQYLQNNVIFIKELQEVERPW